MLTHFSQFQSQVQIFSSMAISAKKSLILPPELLPTVIFNLNIPIARLVCRRVCSHWRKAVDFAIPRMLVGQFDASIEGLHSSEYDGYHNVTSYHYYFKCTAVNGQTVILEPVSRSAEFFPCYAGWTTEYLNHYLWESVCFDGAYEQQGDFEFTISRDTNCARCGPWTLRYEKEGDEESEADSEDDTGSASESDTNNENQNENGNEGEDKSGSENASESEAESQGESEDEDEFINVRFTSLEISINHLLSWDESRKVYIEKSEALRDEAQKQKYEEAIRQRDLKMKLERENKEKERAKKEKERDILEWERKKKEWERKEKEGKATPSARKKCRKCHKQSKAQDCVNGLCGPCCGLGYDECPRHRRRR